MGLETFTDIKSLNALWPLGTDAKSQGDDHIRGIKSVLKASPLANGAQTRNRLVNPAMQINQEAVVSTTTSGQYAADQWTSYHVSSGTFTRARASLANFTAKGGSFGFRTTITVADAALAAADYLTIAQPIEGVRMQDAMWGVSTARQIVVRFGFRGPAGTYAMVITNASEARAYVAPFTISAGQANTEVEQVFVVPGDTTGTWPGSAVLWGYFYVTLAAGTTYQGVAGWQTGPKYGTAAISNGMGTAGAVFEITDVGLYLDPLATGVAPPWVTPDEAEELRACQRYWQSISTLFSGNVTSASGYNAMSFYAASPRTAPAFTATNVSASGFPATVGAFTARGNGFSEARTANGTGAAIFVSTVYINARM